MGMHKSYSMPFICCHISARPISLFHMIFRLLRTLYFYDMGSKEMFHVEFIFTLY